MITAKSAGSYLVERLTQLGVGHIFGVPGDFVLGFDKLIEDSSIKFINTCDEQGAGFAADAYARLQGLGVVCITYCVGGLKVANTTAQAYAEKSPVLVISGSPGTNERVKNPLLHHKVRDFDTQYKVFQQLTVASAVLDDPYTAFAEIDRVINAVIKYKRPGYIEIPRDMVKRSLSESVIACSNSQHDIIQEPETSNALVLEEALNEAVELINKAEKPVILAGVEIHRFGLQEQLLRLVEKTNIPVAETLLGKSVVSELHPNYIGLYEGAMGNENTREYVESSDCLILLGTFLSDINLGIFTAHLEPKHSIYVTSEKTSIHLHNYEEIRLQDFVEGLLTADIKPRKLTITNAVKKPTPFSPVPGQKICVERLFQRLNSFITDNMIVIADVGDALFAGSELFVHDKTRFLSSAYYASLGFAVPGSIGVQLANRNIRPLVLVGDGAFQMTGMELSTAVRYNLNPIVVLLNNQGYGTERPMCDGKFNDLLNWRYSRIPEVLGAGRGFNIYTENELESALKESEAYTESFSLLEVHLDSQDTSVALKRLANALAKNIR